MKRKIKIFILGASVLLLIWMVLLSYSQVEERKQQAKSEEAAAREFLLWMTEREKGNIGLLSFKGCRLATEEDVRESAYTHLNDVLFEVQNGTLNMTRYIIGLENDPGLINLFERLDLSTSDIPKWTCQVWIDLLKK